VLNGSDGHPFEALRQFEILSAGAIKLAARNPEHMRFTHRFRRE
jgi:hypothetical protein